MSILDLFLPTSTKSASPASSVSSIPSQASYHSKTSIDYKFKRGSTSNSTLSQFLNSLSLISFFRHVPATDEYIEMVPYVDNDEVIFDIPSDHVPCSLQHVSDVPVCPLNLIKDKLCPVCSKRHNIVFRRHDSHSRDLPPDTLLVNSDGVFDIRSYTKIAKLGLVSASFE